MEHDTPKTNCAAFAYCHGDSTDLVVTTDFAGELERENAALRRALKQARAWGVNSEGFSAEQSSKLSDWIDAGMVGTPPPIPAYYPPSAALANVQAQDAGLVAPHPERR